MTDDIIGMNGPAAGTKGAAGNLYHGRFGDGITFSVDIVRHRPPGANNKKHKQVKVPSAIAKYFRGDPPKRKKKGDNIHT